MKLRGESRLLWRAVDERGAELDILLQKRRDKVAAKRLFRWVLRSCPTPRKIVTDQLPSYPAAKADITELAGIEHVFVKAAARVNNCAENSHQPPRERERRRRSFRDHTQAFLSNFGPIRQHFALKRHLLRASLYRKHLAARLSARRESQKSPRIRLLHKAACLRHPRRAASLCQRDSAFQSTPRHPLMQVKRQNT